MQDLELKPGTLGRQIFTEFRSTETNSPDVIKCRIAFVFHPVYTEFSIEEHRFADYVLLNRNPDRPNKAVTEFPKSSTLKLYACFPACVPRGITSTDANRLSGKGVEILVGTTPSQDETWSLPVNLLSHHSAYFKAACLWDVKGQINLLGHDPAVFALFIEWMYNGTYDASAFPRNPNIHAKCWVLGDYIICRQFQNYAMGRLFDEHVATAFGIPISFEDVQYVCNSASPDSKLKLFYTDFVTDHFGDIYRLRGCMADWENFLEDHPKTRSALLRKLRYGPPKKPRVKSVTKYLEPEESVSESALRAQVDFARLAEKEEDQKRDQFSFNVDALPPVRGLHWGAPATPLVNFFPTEDTATPLAPNASSQSAVASPLQSFPPKSMAAPVSNPSSQGTAVPSVPKSSQATGAPTLQLFRPQVKPVSIAAKASQSTAAPSAANSFPQGTAAPLLSNASSRVTVAPSVLNLSSQDSAAVLPIPNSLQGTAAPSGSPQGTVAPPTQSFPLQGSAVPSVPNASSEGIVVPLAPNSSQATPAPPVLNSSSQDTAAPVDRVEGEQEKESVGDEINTVSTATQDVIIKESSPSGSTSDDGPETQNTPGSGEE
uniref:BTB domain-containing protein n=1 Tax=Gibberella zeae TaxID=5518 RepID=A0A4E9EPG8_GIBZA